MNRLWLIRTAENKIFGPVGAQKILDLISKGSLKKNDEITSGNGYWIFVKEAGLVEDFLRNGKTQPFNPISEAAYVKISSYEMEFIDQVVSSKYPAEEDLEYPTVSGEKGSTMVKAEGAAEEVVQAEDITIPSENDLEYPEEIQSPSSHDQVDLDEGEIRSIVFDMSSSSSEKKTEDNPELPSVADQKFPEGEDSEYPE